MARPVVVSTPTRRNSKARTYAPSASSSTATSTSTPSVRVRRAVGSSTHVGGTPNFHAVARETKRKIKWDRVLRGAGSTQSTRGSQWKWLENVRNFSIYTKQNSGTSGGYGVLSIGSIRASVQEVASLLASSSQPEYEQKMAALHDKEFKHASYLGDIPTPTSIMDDDGNESNESTTTNLSVRSVIFARPRWLQRDDEWTFLEATHFDTDAQRFETLRTTLSLQDVMPQDRKFRFTDAKPFRDIIAGYRVQPEDPSLSMSEPVEPTQGGFTTPTVRVHFYAEIESSAMGRGLGRFVRAPAKHEASLKAMKQRMLTIAKDCDRLAQLVRRRRLGLQVLVDQRRVLPPTNVKCVNCDRTQLFAKLCRVCGQGVCGDCSDKYERETHKLRSRSLSHSISGGNGSSSEKETNSNRLVRLETIRVCDPCLARVEAADYSYMDDAALTGVGVFPNAPRKGSLSSSRVSQEQSPSAAEDLKQLLHDALLGAPSSQRKGAVMNVIRCVLDQEAPPPSPAMSTTSNFGAFEPVMLTPMSADRDYLFALDKLDLPTQSVDTIETSDMEGRGYAVQPSHDVAHSMPFPIQTTETKRIDEINKLGLLASGQCDELNIICDIAAKEMGAFATFVAIVTADSQHVVGTNVPAMENMVVNRDQSFCQHTIMSDKPLIVPNPEADVRFSRIMPVTDMGVKYYCGFPIVSGDDNTVIGSLCCVDQKKHEMTESQFSAMQRLATTAGRVVQIQGKKHRTTSFAASTTAASPAGPATTKREL